MTALPTHETAALQCRCVPSKQPKHFTVSPFLYSRYWRFHVSHFKRQHFDKMMVDLSEIGGTFSFIGRVIPPGEAMGIWPVPWEGPRLCWHQGTWPSIHIRHLSSSHFTYIGNKMELGGGGVPFLTADIYYNFGSKTMWFVTMDFF